MHKGYQKENRGLRYIAVKPEIYNKLVELGTMKSSFNDVVSEIMLKAGIEVIGPEYNGDAATE